MFLRKKTKKRGDKTYTYYQLVEAYATPKGPRQRVVASLGDLSPRPREEWHRLMREVEVALSGQTDFTVESMSEDARSVAERVRENKRARKAAWGETVVAVDLAGVETKEARELGPEYVGVSMWERLGLDATLESCGLSPSVCKRVKLMVVNALCEYESEHAMPGWARRTAIGELVGLDTKKLSESSLYRTLDALLPHREKIEKALAAREANLFALSNTLVLYDLTSTYFEGEMQKNPLAQRGYSRDGRPDCKQVVMGLILDGEGFVKGHLLFEGNRRDSTTLKEMVRLLDARMGENRGTVVMDRGLATQENLAWLREAKRSYIVALRQGEREAWQEEFLRGEWEEVSRPEPPTHPGKKRPCVEVQRVEREKELYVLCRSEGRKEKDAAIRRRFCERLEGDLERLRRRVKRGRLKKIEKIHEAVGRLRERYPRVVRFYEIEVVPEGDTARVEWRPQKGWEQEAEERDGTYLLRTNRLDWSAEEIWKTYIMLTHVESAFRHLKSTLNFRPVRHHLAKRGEAHLFVCVLAYHLLHLIESTLRRAGDYRSWATIRRVLRTHQVNTIVLPVAEEDGDVYEIRKPSLAEPEHRAIYEKLDMDTRVNRYPRTRRKQRK